MRILVVDDDKAVRRALGVLLEKSGFTVSTVDCGMEALQASEETEFDLVLLDVLLPDIGGIEVCRELKAKAEAFLPIILITAQDSPEGRIDGLESGADDYLQKPFDSRELLARVKALLRIRALHSELKRLAAVREQIVYTVSHDYRTPLVGIRGAIQNLLTGLVGDLTPEQREYLELVDQATLRLSQLTDEMCKAARKRETDGQEPRDAIDIKKAVETASAGLRPEIVKKKLRLEVKTEPGSPCAWGEREAFVQVVANLLDNAVKHSPEGGRILVEIGRRVSSGGLYAHVSVSDEGPGVARSDQDRIFYRFEQVGDPQLTGSTGAGLGLAICKETVEGHGGRIWVESEDGQGANFHVLLPGVVPVGGAA
ncbi:MAG: hybrid sensor histidine kinase/response regulator [Planctomycetota bacterium]|jgi:signal transduction histidine kinase